MSGNNVQAQGISSQEGISSLTNIPLPMDYYNLVDAVRLAKFKFKIPNCTPKLLVYYATKQSINLFTPVQDSLEFTLVDTLAESNHFPFSLNTQTPHHHPQNHFHFLVLGMAACLDFVSNGKTKQRKFPNAYTYYNCKLELTHTVSNWEWQIVSDHSSTLQPMDATEEGKKNFSAHNLSGITNRDIDSKTSPLDQLLEKNDGNKRTKGVKRDPKTIALTDSNILISHAALYKLIPIIKDEIKRNEANNQLQNPQKFISSDPGNDFPSACYSLAVAASKTQDCKPMDMLARAIRRNIALLTIVPDGIDVRSSNCLDNFSGEEFQWKPQLLALNKTDCEQIYYNQICEEKNVFKYDFTEGYIIDNYGHLYRVLPTDERPSLASEWISWRTFQGLGMWQLELTVESLYVMHSDLTKLTDPEPQDFDIPKRAKEFLLPKDYPSLMKAAELTKLKHPECTLNHLLIFGKLKLLDFITPVPVGIELHTCRIRKKDVMSGKSAKGTPELLVLSPNNCENIDHDGIAKENGFFKGYSIVNGQLNVNHASDVDGGWWWLTYYKSKLHEIELCPDRIFVMKANLFQIINADQSQWELVDNLVNENETKKLQALPEIKADEPVNPDTKEKQKFTDDILAEKDLLQSAEEIEWILEDIVLGIVGFKRRKMQSLIASNDFPKGTIRGEKNKNHWKKPEILAWFEANKFEPVITGKRKLKATIAVEKDAVPTESPPPEVQK
jgi:hypothetical protein